MTDTTERLSPRKAAKARTKQRVLDAGRAVFAEVGYAEATIRKIAARAGLSTGAVFASFDDKAQLYRAVYGIDPVPPEMGRALLLIAAGTYGSVEPLTEAERRAAFALIEKATAGG